MRKDTTVFSLPDWAFEFHRHRCPFMPIGYRMGSKTLGARRDQGHDYSIFAELGVGHPQTRMMDGLQASNGCTYGKLMIERQNFGKLAATSWTPSKGSVRIAVKPDFTDMLGKFEFFKYRKKGIEPSRIPEPVRLEVIHKVLNGTDDELFDVKLRPTSSTRRFPARSTRPCARSVASACSNAIFGRRMEKSYAFHVRDITDE